MSCERCREGFWYFSSKEVRSAGFISTESKEFLAPVRVVGKLVGYMMKCLSCDRDRSFDAERRQLEDSVFRMRTGAKPDENANELFFRTGRPSGVFFCTQCKHVGPYGSKVAMEECCKMTKCKTCDEMVKHRTECVSCTSMRWERNREASWAKLEPVRCQDLESTTVAVEGDDTLREIEQVIEDIECGETSMDVRVHPTRLVQLSFDAESIVEHEIDEWYEGALDDFGRERLVSLQETLDAWCVEHEFTCLQGDESRRVDFTDYPFEMQEDVS